MRKCWVAYVALDMATQRATAYSNVRIRICHKSAVYDFHLLSLPVHNRHTGEIIFNTVAKSMDHIYSDRRKMIVGASSYGKKNMTGQHQGVITRIQHIAKPRFM